MEQEQQHHDGENYGGRVEINSSSFSQYQLPVHEYGNSGFLNRVTHGLPTEPTASGITRRQLLPLLPRPTWPSMLLATPTGYHALPHVSALAKPKLPARHAPSHRKNLTDDERRRMCRYHKENPSAKQKEIGAMFGVERSTVSKILRQKEKYLFPEDRSLSPVRSANGKYPDIERAQANWPEPRSDQTPITQDDALEAVNKFLSFVDTAPINLVDQDEYKTILEVQRKLTAGQPSCSPSAGNEHEYRGSGGY